MQYNAIPANVVGVESGHIKGKGNGNQVLVETAAISELAALHREEKDRDSTRNVVVISFENLVDKKDGKQAIVQFALKMDDCRELCRDLLIHLDCAGDEVARYLNNQLSSPQSEDEDEED